MIGCGKLVGRVVGITGRVIELGIDARDSAGGVIGELVAGERPGAPAAARRGRVSGVNQAGEPAKSIVGVEARGNMVARACARIAIDLLKLPVGVVAGSEGLAGDRIAAADALLYQTRQACTLSYWYVFWKSLVVPILACTWVSKLSALYWLVYSS